VLICTTQALANGTPAPEDHVTLELSFHGAARTVTGSCFRLKTRSGTVLVDCGLFQGSKTLRELNYQPFPFRPADIDAVVLTHAHIDHSGLLPKLARLGFKGTIHTTVPTVDLCSVMLPDSGHIQESEVERLNRRNRQRGRKLVEPIYTLRDALAAMDQFAGHDYETWVQVLPGVRVRFWNAGHMLGSSSVEMQVSDSGSRPVTLFFSGDLGPEHKLLQPDAEAPAGYDYLLCESTFGATDRASVLPDERRAQLAKYVQSAAEKRGALLIPSFAVERTQEVVTDLMLLMHNGEAPAAPVFIDSPLAHRATEIFLKHADMLENSAALKSALNSPNLQFSESVEDSKAIGRLSGYHVIISASGMCDAGRIRHHLKNHLYRPNATVLMVGYQAQGTLGRILLEGAKTVKIHGEEVNVEAAIEHINSYSGHADAPELEQWIAERLPVHRNLFLTHGEEEGMTGLAGRVAAKLLPSDRIITPEIDDAFRLDGEVARQVDSEIRRHIDPPEAAREPDWNNELTQLMFDIDAALDKQAGGRNRSKLIRRLRQALEEAG
jgi:metallo-beta-lactamase family protein